MTSSSVVRVPLALLAVLVLGLLAAARGAAAPDPVVPFPVQVHTCDQTPPGWPTDPQFPDIWCGTWTAGATRTASGDAAAIEPLGTVTLHRISEADANRLFFYNTVGGGAFPPLPFMNDAGYTNWGCIDMIRDGIAGGRYYLGTFVNGDERGYVGACTNLGNFPTVLNGSFVSQTSADPAIDPTLRVRRQGDFSLRITKDLRVADGQFTSVLSAGDLTTAPIWYFTATRQGLAPEGFMSAGVRDSVVAAGAVSFTSALITCAIAAKWAGVATVSSGFLGTVMVPAAATICGGAIIGTVASAGLVATDSLIRSLRSSHESSLGPAAPSSRAAATRRVLLPRPRPVSGDGLASCPAGPRGGACRRLRPLAARYVTAVGTIASAQQAATDAVGRYAQALQAGDATGVTLQSGVGKVYLGLLGMQITERQRAGRALAAGLRAQGLDITMSGAQASQAAGLLTAPGGLPSSATRWLRGAGMSSSGITAALQQASDLAQAGTGPITLQGVLTGPATSTAPLAAAYRSITVAEVRQMVLALVRQRALGARLATRLQADLARLSGATGAARAPTARRLRSDATRAPGRYGILLQLAISPLGR